MKTISESIGIGQNIPLRQNVARALLWIEKYPLPVLYFWLVWQRWEALRALYHQYLAATLAPDKLEMGWQNLYYISLARNSLLLILMVFVGLTLLLNRAPSVPPKTLKHVIIPLVTSCYFILFGFVDKLPPAWSENLAPREWWPVLTLAGLSCSLVGYAVSLWALCYLRRSFAMMIAVRRIVLGGPYAYVRHPMYLGSLLDKLGFLLVSCCPATGLLVVGFVLLVTIRARMEDQSLTGASAEYERHYRSTGLFFPRWQQVSYN